MMKKLHLNIVSPEKGTLQRGSGKCYIAGHYGLFFILPQHAPIVSSLERGN